MHNNGHAQAAGHDHGHDHGAPESFIRKYVFSVDHKVIGIQYGLTAMVFLFLGFCFVLLMRWQLAFPEQALPVIGRLFGVTRMPEGVMLPEFYNQLGAMHGTIMVFLGVVPLAVGAFGNYLVPLQVGAPDMAFPKLNAASYWLFFVGGVIMLVSFFIPGGAAKSGWTSYPPLSVIETGGQTWWLVGMVFLINSSLLGSINIITTIVQLRAPGLKFMRMPFFIWAQLVTSLLLVLAFPPLEVAGFMQLLDRVAGTSFFMPSGLVISGEPYVGSGGGNAVLWQHLFWFLAHPEVYVLILPAMGIVCEVLANNSRKPLYGYKALVYSVIFLGFMSFIVWAHHMFLTGMGTAISTFFQLTTMIISVPSIIILSVMILSLWGGSIRFTTPMLFALAFIPMFGIGGLTGLPLGLSVADIYLHDTYYVIAHFHFVVAPGTLMALFAGIYYWYPKVTGRRLNDLLGRLHFWPTLVFMVGTFLPMFVLGMAGVSRRLYDGGATYAHAQDYLWINQPITFSAWGLALAQVFFIVNFFVSLKNGEKVEDNPWQGTTLEWATTSPPLGHGNFEGPITVYRGPYEYSVPKAKRDFSPQHLKRI